MELSQQSKKLMSKNQNSLVSKALGVPGTGTSALDVKVNPALVKLVEPITKGASKVSVP